MDGWKSWISSKTLWIGLIALLANLGGMFGYDVNPEDQNLLGEHFSLIGNSVAILAMTITRITATKKLKLTGKD